MWIAHVKNLTSLLYQTLYSAVVIDTCFEIRVPPDVGKQVPAIGFIVKKHCNDK